MRIRTFAIAVLALVALTAAASASPIVEIGTGTDVNFTFSVVHSSSGGFDGQSGTILYDVFLDTDNVPSTYDVGVPDAASPSGLADIASLFVDIVRRSDSEVETFKIDGKFDSVDLADGLFDANTLVGYLDFTALADGDGVDFTDLDGETFYFEDRTYSSAVLPPNTRIGDTVTLWGATVFSGPKTLGAAGDLSPGGRGIDLRIELPEPASLALLGAAVAAGALLRRRRKTA